MSTWFDLLLVTDIARSGDAGLRIAHEARAFSAAGYRIGLLHQKFGQADVILPDIQQLVRDGIVSPVAADANIDAALVIVHAPGLVRSPLPPTPGVSADHVLLVHDRPITVEQMGLWQCFGYGSTTWVPTNRWVRQSLEALQMPIPILEEDWRSIAAAVPSFKNNKNETRPYTVGRISTDEADQWIEDTTILRASHKLPRGMQGYAIGTPRNGKVRPVLSELGWTILNRDKMSAARLIGMIDALVYVPSRIPREIPEAAISTALASGKSVILSECLKDHVGPAATYCAPEDLETVLAELVSVAPPGDISDAGETSSNFDVAADTVLRFGDQPRLSQVRRLLDDVPETRTAARPRENARVLCVSSNGIGLGHLTRLLAIARRLNPDLSPVFATQCSAVSIVESFGFEADYVPSYGATESTMTQWDAWYSHEMRALLDRHDPPVVVFDGNHLTPGLVDAVMSHGSSSLAWVRRGMYGRAAAPFIDNARFCDLIIEPGELAGEDDNGVTKARQAEAVVTAPITLLDKADLKARDAAREALGLGPNRPAVLVHLGAGANRNLPGLTEQVIRHLRKLPDVQIVLAEWVTGVYAFPPFQGVKMLTGYPISQYFSAFDFSIASSGYNSFHEVVAFGLPTLFIANRDPSMDDQGARAAFAQANSAGLDLHESELSLLPTVLDAMMSARLQGALRQGCAALQFENGAHSAAREIERLVERS